MRLSPTQLTAIERRYGSRAAAAVQAHPYRLVHDIPGVSFQTADTIARKLGAGKASPARLQAGVLAVLQQAVRQGHTGLPMPTAIRRATRLLGVPRTVVEEYCLRGVLAGGGAFVVEQHGAETFFTSRARNRTPGGERYRAVSGGNVSGKSEGGGSLRIAAAQAAVK